MTKILVVGDLIIDNYLTGHAARISPEAPVAIVDIENEQLFLGGAGNVVNNLLAFGMETDILSVIGGCPNTALLERMLIAKNISTKYLIKEKDRPTSKKTRIIAEKQQILRFDQERICPINSLSEQKVLSLYRQIITNYDAIILSDYNKGLLTQALTTQLIKLANQHNIKILVDPKGCDYRKYHHAYLLTPNIKEAGAATQIPIYDEADIKKASIYLKERYDLKISLITLSDKGIAIFDKNFRIHPTKAKEVFDVTGAGDTVIAALAFRLAKGDTIDVAVDFANLAAGVVVSKIGSSTASLAEIEDHLLDKKIKDIRQIKAISKALKERDKKIVFTNGCFDILHFGHIQYLTQARTYGDVLIVGINSDASVKHLKGNGRPILSELDRSTIIANLKMVDFVVVFNEPTPIRPITEIMPDIIVKGGDYQKEDVVGKDIAKEVKIVPYIADKSSSHIIEKIQNKAP